MTWKYDQSSGRMFYGVEVVGTGYAGSGSGRNNPAMEEVSDTGPIPRGRYRISAPYDTADHGPHVMALTPVGHDARGRYGFLIHGDNLSHTASKGCIIMGRAVRNRISASGDTDLEVVE